MFLEVVAVLATICGVSATGVIGTLVRSGPLAVVRRHNQAEPVVRSLSVEDAWRGIIQIARRAVEFEPDVVFGINRGGALVGAYIAKQLRLPYVHLLHVNCDLDEPVVGRSDETNSQ